MLDVNYTSSQAGSASDFYGRLGILPSEMPASIRVKFGYALRLCAVSLWDGWARQVGRGHVCVKLVPRSLPARAITSCTGRLPAARTRAPQGPRDRLYLTQRAIRCAMRPRPDRAVRYRKTHARTQRARLEGAATSHRNGKTGRRRLSTGGEKGVDWQRNSQP